MFVFYFVPMRNFNAEILEILIGYVPKACL